MVREFGVSYYGVMLPDRVDGDFHEMIEHGVNSVLLGVGEYDAWFWAKAIPRIVDKAKSYGLTVYIDLWGWGKVFGGEPPSIFLQDRAGHRQVTSGGRVMPAACMNSDEFRSYVFERAERLSAETEADYFFLDEPHFSFYVQRPRGYSFRILREWTCACENCRQRFRDAFGYDMPSKLTEDLIRFRQDTVVSFLRELSAAIKKADNRKRIAVCLLPAVETGGVTDRLTRPFKELVGIVDWEEIARMGDVDMVGTDPYWIALEKLLPTRLFFDGLKWYRRTLNRLIALALKYEKETQAWVQAFNVPAGKEEEIVKGIEIAVEVGVNSIFAWPYRAGKFSVLESERADLLWDMIGEVYKKYGSGG